jgi:hypothetical protein
VGLFDDERIIALPPVQFILYRVRMNNEPQGIYLLVEKPHQATSHMKSTYMVRRGLDHKIDTEYDDTNSKEQAKPLSKAIPWFI